MNASLEQKQQNLFVIEYTIKYMNHSLLINAKGIEALS